MKTLNLLNLKRLLFGASIIALATFTVSCGDDDEVNCSKLEEQGFEASLELFEAWSNEDCEGIEAAYQASIKILRKGKSCQFVKDLMEEYEVETIAELEAEFQSQRDFYLDDAGCNDTK
jgi:hypothetical protein